MALGKDGQPYWIVEANRIRQENMSNNKIFTLEEVNKELKATLKESLELCSQLIKDLAAIVPQYEGLINDFDKYAYHTSYCNLMGETSTPGYGCTCGFYDAEAKHKLRVAPERSAPTTAKGSQKAKLSCTKPSLTSSQKYILELLQPVYEEPNQAIQPSILGKLARNDGFPLGRSSLSAWACTRLKRLMELGLVKRNNDSTYQITKKGTAWVSKDQAS